MRKYQDPDYYDEPEWDEDEEEGDVPPKKHHTLLLVLAIILVPICAMFFGYESADQKAKADEIAKTTFAGRLASEAHQAQLPTGGSQLIFYYSIDQMTTEDLNDWYFNIIQKQMYYSDVILDDKDSMKNKARNPGNSLPGGIALFFIENFRISKAISEYADTSTTPPKS